MAVHGKDRLFCIWQEEKAYSNRENNGCGWFWYPEGKSSEPAMP
jgi:hypothetical protein